jgi:hypothetical protein
MPTSWQKMLQYAGATAGHPDASEPSSPTKPFPSSHETILKQSGDIQCTTKNGGDNGIHPQPNLPRISQERSSRHGKSGRPTVMADIVSSLFIILSASVFFAHALDAYRCRAT